MKLNACLMVAALSWPIPCAYSASENATAPESTPFFYSVEDTLRLMLLIDRYHWNPPPEVQRNFDAHANPDAVFVVIQGAERLKTEDKRKGWTLSQSPEWLLLQAALIVRMKDAPAMIAAASFPQSYEQYRAAASVYATLADRGYPFTEKEKMTLLKFNAPPDLDARSIVRVLSGAINELLHFPHEAEYERDYRRINAELFQKVVEEAKRNPTLSETDRSMRAPLAERMKRKQETIKWSKLKEEADWPIRPIPADLYALLREHNIIRGDTKDKESERFLYSVDDTMRLMLLIDRYHWNPPPEVQRNFDAHANPDAALVVIQGAKNMKSGEGRKEWNLSQGPDWLLLQAALIVRMKDAPALVAATSSPEDTHGSTIAAAVYSTLSDREYRFSEEEKTALLKLKPRPGAEADYIVACLGNGVAHITSSPREAEYEREYRRINEELLTTYAEEAKKDIVLSTTDRSKWVPLAERIKGRQETIKWSKLKEEGDWPIRPMPDDLVALLRKHGLVRAEQVTAAEAPEGGAGDAEANAGRVDADGADGDDGFGAPFAELRADPERAWRPDHVAREGMRAFGQYRQWIAAGEYARLPRVLMDNGRPLPARKAREAEQGEKSFAGAMDALKKLFAGLPDAPAAGYADVEIAVRYEARIPTLPRPDGAAAAPAPEAGAEGVRCREVVTLFFVLPGTAAPYKAYAPNIGGESALRTVSPDGDLRVYMQRVNGQWYWNPFGW